MRHRKIIINADDFGMSPETNRAIVSAFDAEKISSTTLMANMPAFEEACELGKRYHLLGKIGVHLNLIEGFPLSEPIRRVPLFCDAAGMFRPRKVLFRLTAEEARAVELEFAAQIDTCVARGIRPTHLDSHQHVHTVWPVGAIVIDIARRYRIGAIRLSRNCGSGIGLRNRLYKSAYNARLKLYGLAKTRYFGSAADVVPLLTSTHDDVEIMVHFTVANHWTIPNIWAQMNRDGWALQNQLTSYA